MEEKEQNRQSGGNPKSPEAEVLAVLNQRGNNAEANKESKTINPKPQESPADKETTKPDFWQPTEEEKSNKKVPFETENEQEESQTDLTLEAQAGAEEHKKLESDITPGLAPPAEKQIDNGEVASKLERWANDMRKAA
jgi:hypothetical protein